MTYPLMVKLKGKLVVVVGGGAVATRKIKRLIQEAADVTVVSPYLSESLQILIHDHNHRLTWVQDRFKALYIKDAFLVIAATDDRDVNRSVFEAVNQYQLVNIVDQPELSNFYVPSMLKRGELTISVSTGGASPMLAKHICQDLEKTYDERYEEYLEFLLKSRKDIIEHVPERTKRKQMFQELASKRFLEAADRQRELEKLMKKLN
ncbi:NAD(P)-binding protein [Desertibacillus haloalkaliphilus]|uniref:NAD(P)-binding protein n=1 Tax=Desertibacillus haloalkaliphilus TaxID=1328930 RepID=UPI001C2740C4|nr:NAD(P)-binding protein [Desertibacillus haloalkaliphilus]MBU8907805.1 NAD(P)-binding protein [Desertibacillus haloalkaliphilus]